MALGTAKIALIGASANQNAPFDPYTYLAPTFVTAQNCTLSNGNRTAALSFGVQGLAYSAGQNLSGRTYTEFKIDDSTNHWIFGWTKFTALAYSNDYWGMYNNVIAAPSLILNFGPPGVQSPGSIPFANSFVDANGNPISLLPTGSVISIAIDVDVGTAWIGVDGEWYNNGGPKNDADPLATQIVNADVTGILLRFSNHVSVGGTGTILTESEALYFNGGNLF